MPSFVRSPWVALPAVLVLGIANAQELRRETVTDATRLDWAFAASAFGADAAKLPKDYDSRAQQYQVYVPEKYLADKAWPLIAFISPGDGPTGWGNFRHSCTERGMFFCAPYNAGNATPAGPRVRMILDMLDDVRRKHRIDPDRTYLAGFSGGGRMACTIAFYLPEYFAGALPICGTNGPPRLTYLRHRLRDRLSVAFVTGAKDFNRKENEEYMHPFFAELGVRSKLWVAAKTAHAIPPADVIDSAVGWLEEALPRRRSDSASWPGLSIAADRTPTADDQAAGLLRAAKSALAREEHIWRGVALLQGAVARWPKTTAGKQASQLLQEAAADAKVLKHVEVQGSDDETRFLTAQAKAFERFGMIAKAIEAWELLAQSYTGTPTGRIAAAEAARLRQK